MPTVIRRMSGDGAGKGQTLSALSVSGKRRYLHMWTCPYVHMWIGHLSSDPIKPMLLEKQIDGLFSQSLGRAFQIHRQHPELFPSLRFQIDR